MHVAFWDDFDPFQPTWGGEKASGRRKSTRVDTRMGSAEATELAGGRVPTVGERT